jgi:carboxylesterase
MKIGVLWFPGWTSTEHDLHEMMQYLQEKGIEYKSINLKGHNTKSSDLHGVTYQDWLYQAERAYLQAMKKWDIVFVGGLSTGGQLALYIASKYPVNGIISIGTPLRIKIQWSMRYFAHLLKYIPYQIQKKNSFPEKRIQEISLSRKGAYNSFPISSAAQVYLLTKQVRRFYIKKVKDPILLIQSTTDHLIPDYNIDIFKKWLKTPAKYIQTMWIKDSYHLVNLDHSKEKVFKKIYAFIQKYSMIQKDK